MNIGKKQIKQLLTLGILLILAVSFSLCIGGDENGNGDDNGDNGDNGGNGGNGGDNNTTEIINITDIRQEPMFAPQGQNVDILAWVESKNPISKVEIIICVGTTCFAPELMTENPGGSNRYLYTYQVPQGESGTPPEIKITVKVWDSLKNTNQKDFYLQVV